MKEFFTIFAVFMMCLGVSKILIALSLSIIRKRREK